ncbi:HtrA protease/chaperone protein / Serine protease (Protease DO) [[Actinomadura] parvosata subsp. kistnae]|uniref:Serine protease n=1 Tax=[Actinomadura] parvosata subsp. kistnae TaxID=1909395 RepID=A0A1V0AEB5_9ACTN|nr:trypsin-like peptidase domain-containing protein [Nonomuraea sp. ATCC 55076]AQZ68509.1 serine protease [Nonomuraea sp. ATCC 55076]SPL93032.1 HtrA protease/chaperone protein / Serine protease (Protease DO) [Actinomadura parvosata subsp. kistnae]
MERVPQEAGAGEAQQAQGASAGRRARRFAAAGAALVVVAVLAYWLGGLGGGDGREAAPRPSPSPSPSTTLTVPDVYKRVGPSVVVIQAGKSLGTGVIAAEDGTILTAYHVVKGAKDVDLTFADGTKAKAEITSSNAKRDVATLKPAKLPEIVVPATIGGAVAVGAPVVAIGNPLGLTYSVSTGVVSGLNRSAEKGDLSGLIQFDASVNPGSSGGPLLDARGLLVGIVVSIADPGGDEAFAGIAFAVPIGLALGGGEGDGPPGEGLLI